MEDTIPLSNHAPTVGDDVARVALITGVVALLAVGTLVLFFTVGGPFGTVNDILNAGIGVSSAVLAVTILRSIGGSPAATALALAGAAITVFGSWLVISGTSGFQLAGFVSGVGFALIGAWLLVSLASGGLGDALSPLASRAGMAAGAIMLVGVLGLAGAAMRIDSAADTPYWLWLYGIGWLGTYLVFPAWCLLLASSA
jgi:hypothetical protein